MKQKKKSSESNIIYNKASGITLIALVVTIIVLLILLGIILPMLTGRNGLINKAIETQQKVRKAQAEEKVRLEVLGSYNLDGK